MINLDTFFETSFENEPSIWEEALKKELKLADISSKKLRKNLDTDSWKTLSLEATSYSEDSLSLGRVWKKASQTYLKLTRETILENLQDGVRLFFIFKSKELNSSWKLIEDIFFNHPDKNDIEIIFLGNEDLSFYPSGLKWIDESQMPSGRLSHEAGGNNSLELASILVKLIDKIRNNQADLATFLFLDSQFFKNIAKVRALKLLIAKVLEEFKLSINVPIVGLTSLREWTFFERYTNILRNNTSVASGLIADVDMMQSTGYQFLFDLINHEDSVHTLRANRLARNSFHILSLESMLGVVQDSASGSYHLEDLTHYYAEKSWQKMQELVDLSPIERDAKIVSEARLLFEKRVSDFNHRKLILSGVNDYPNSKELLNEIELSNVSFKRVSSHFENLRLQTQKLKKSPRVCIGILGDEGVLSQRINFCRNYFELLGLEVIETKNKTEIENHPDVTVVCLVDSEIEGLDLNLKAKEKFIAGKIPFKDFANIYMGQNVFEVLSGLVSRWEQL